MYISWCIGKWIHNRSKECYQTCVTWRWFFSSPRNIRYVHPGISPPTTQGPAVNVPYYFHGLFQYDNTEILDNQRVLEILQLILYCRWLVFLSFLQRKNLFWFQQCHGRFSLIVGESLACIPALMYSEYPVSLPSVGHQNGLLKNLALIRIRKSVSKKQET